VAAIDSQPEQTVIRHRVKRGETLSTIARRYEATVHGILEANGLRQAHRITAGQDLVIPMP
jgi:nucleoid-associated protein YgaU